VGPHLLRVEVGEGEALVGPHLLRVEVGQGEAPVGPHLQGGMLTSTMLPQQQDGRGMCWPCAPTLQVLEGMGSEVQGVSGAGLSGAGALGARVSGAGFLGAQQHSEEGVLRCASPRSLSWFSKECQGGSGSLCCLGHDECALPLCCSRHSFRHEWCACGLPCPCPCSR